MGTDKVWDAAKYEGGFRFVTAGGEPLLDLLAPHGGERIVDLGCGTGELTARIAATGAEVTGLDADPAMIRRARERFPALSFVEADAQTRTLPGPVDAVFSNAALHWMRRPAEVIARVAAALRPGGRFVAELGGHGNVAAVQRALESARASLGLPPVETPWFFPSVGRYAGLLEAAGLEPRAMWLFDRPSPLGDEGLAGWIHMFGTPFLVDLAPAQVQPLIDAACAHARAALHRDAQWVADYRRLRFIAVRVE
jgi:trans-aconitate methyltransferase